MPEKPVAAPTEAQDREAPQPADLLQLLRPLQLTRLADHVVEQLQELVLREGLEAATGSTSEWVAADHLFHAAVIRAGGYAYLEALYEAVHTSMVSVLYGRWVEREISPAWLVGANRLRQIDLHRPIVEAVRAGYAEQLASALDRHHLTILEHIDQLYIDERLPSPPKSESS